MRDARQRIWRQKGFIRVYARGIACAACALLLVGETRAARGDIESDIKAVLLDKTLGKADVGIAIVLLGDSEQSSSIVFRHESDVPLAPASNLKLATTAAALEKLGPDFKFRTMLARRGNDLILIGDGDPTFGDADLLRKVGWNVTSVFQNWAEALKKRGITSVAKVLVDDSIFEQKFIHPDWSPSQIDKSYSAGVAGMNLNTNCVDFYCQPRGAGQTVSYTLNPPTRLLNIKNECIGGGDNEIVLTRTANTNDVVLRGSCSAANQVPASITVNDPAIFAATVLAETLAGSGIRVTGQIGRDRSVRAALAQRKPGEAGDITLLAVHETPIAQVLNRANKDSVNLYAECLCKHLGATTANAEGSWENGSAATSAFLKGLGLDETQYHLDDGCGLAKENRLSPHAIVAILMHEYFSPNRRMFMDSLSVAGEDGTLDRERRFRGTALRGRILAKTGHIDGVNSLSGYVQARDDQWYAFSILMNHVPKGANALQDAIVRAIDTNARPQTRSTRAEPASNESISR